MSTLQTTFGCDATREGVIAGGASGPEGLHAAAELAGSPSRNRDWSAPVS